MTLSILSSDDTRWAKTIDAFPAARKDIHFLSSYGKIYEEVYGFKAHLAVWEEKGAFIIQPFVLRKLNDLPFLKDTDAQAYYDFSHPYGYGGPLASNDPIIHSYPEFYAAFHDYCVQQGYATEFCSLHPLLIDAQKTMAEKAHTLRHQKDVFSVPLEGDLLESFSQSHRRNYRKAINAGVTIEKMPVTAETLARFQEIYIYTMERHGAADRWFFPDNYFPACHKYLGDGGASMFFAHHEGKLASACFLIHAFDTAYYHFGGSYEQFHETRASNLLMTEAMLWAQKQGYKNFHLGGGVTSSPDDKLAQFKRGFGARAYPLYNYEKIHNSEVYEALCTRKLGYEHKMQDKPVNEGYFPLYRR